LFFQHRDFEDCSTFEPMTRDILRDPFYRRLERNYNWVLVYITSILIFFLIGVVVGWPTGGSAMAGVQFGLSLVVWGVFLRTVLMWHLTWSISSVTHVWGYQSYATGDCSRNNVLIGLLSMGEGWHNNHHADTRAASHGHKWWELDITWLTICLLEKLGLARQVVRPRVWTEG
jgi:stearoyl-CoA desaturase (delta-9 desaturase)